MTPTLLAPLRDELNLHAGPSLANGQPSWTLEDPVRNQFFRIDWLTYEVLARWSFANPDDIAASISTATPMKVEPDDVLQVAQFLKDQRLLRPDPRASAADMARERARLRGAWHQQLLHHYLFFRIPLVRPDRWLDRIAPSFAWLDSSLFAKLTLLALLLGGAQVYRMWDQFTSTLQDTFTLSGILSYAIALVGVKCAHEMGHALAAKRYGCRVPTMGVAFMVLWPVPYTDTNEVWRLADRKARLRVAAAGVRMELAIAAWATLAWVLLPDGMLRSIAFPLATTTWIATLAINTSPFMRFDGYFLLSDWLDFPNLHARAFALARWDLRERLFSLGEAPPEYVSRRRHIGLIVFAWATWLYRLTLFLGIAVLVYHFFIKVVGIFLFAVELAWFVARPLCNEMAVWRKLWPQVRRRRRPVLATAALLGVLLLALVPWPTRLQASGILRPTQMFAVHAPAGVQVEALPVPEGGAVKAGQPLLRLQNAHNASKQQELQARIERLRWQADAASLDPEQRPRTLVLREELATAQAELAALAEDAARYAPVAPFDGHLRDLSLELAPGVSLGKDEKVAVLVRQAGYEVDTYVGEYQVRRLKVGDKARFYIDSAEGPVLPLVVTAIDADAAATLPGGAWSAQHGGTVPARDKQGAWYPEQSVYHVTLAVDGTAGVLAGRTWRGKVVIQGAAEAPAVVFIQSAAAVIWRELGF